MRIGIFGGTFDPPHIGHLILAAEALDQLQLDQLLWVLTPYPPHKRGQQISALEERLPLLQAAVKPDPSFELSRIDIDRPPPHYAVDTVELLRARHPQAMLIYLMGGDSLHDLREWHEPRRFVQACDEIGVMRRVGDEVNLRLLEAQLPGLSAKVRFIDAPLVEISATDIRQRVAEGRPFRYLVPPGVYWLIVSAGLYRQG